MNITKTKDGLKGLFYINGDNFSIIEIEMRHLILSEYRYV